MADEPQPLKPKNKVGRPQKYDWSKPIFCEITQKLVPPNTVFDPVTGRRRKVRWKGHAWYKMTMEERYPNASPEELAKREAHAAKCRVAMAKGRAVQAAGRKDGTFLGRWGLPDGWSRKELERHADNCAPRIKKLAKAIMAQADIDNERAEKALTFAVSVLEMEAAGHKDQLTAARLILDFSRAKPVSKSEVTVKTAEDWMAEVAKEAGIE